MVGVTADSFYWIVAVFYEPHHRFSKKCWKEKKVHLADFFPWPYISTFPLSRINHNERLEFLGDAVVEFLTRWDGASLIDAAANWSRLQCHLPLCVFFSSSLTLPLRSSFTLILYNYLALSQLSASHFSTYPRQWFTGNWNSDVIFSPC